MSDAGDSTRRREWLEDRGTLWGASAAVILLVLAGLAAVLLWGDDNSRAVAPAPSSPSNPAATVPAGGGATTPATGSCNLPAGDQTVPTAPPAGVQWSVVNTVALPWSATAGPVQREGGVWTCYAHNPTGALLAAAALSVTPDSPQGAEVLERQAVPGPARAARVASLHEQPPQPKQAGETATIAGYRFLDYGSDRATVQIVGAYGGQYLVVTVPLVWSSGDWKLNLEAPVGAVPGQPLASLAGYIQWGAR